MKKSTRMASQGRTNRNEVRRLAERLHGSVCTANPCVFHNRQPFIDQAKALLPTVQREREEMRRNGLALARRV